MQPVTSLAWPFGIFDDELMKEAHTSGYKAAFTIERRTVSANDAPMALPRFMILHGQKIEQILGSFR